MWGFIVKIIVVGRTMPTESTGSIGLFEYEQAKALSDHFDITYLFVDNQSIKKNKKIKRFYDDGIVLSLGIYLPIGGLYKKLFNKIKFYLFKNILDQYILLKGKPDVVHFHFPLLTLNDLILDYLKEMNVKIVCTEHWTKVATENLTYDEKLLLTRYLNEADRVIAVSTELKNVMSKYQRVSKDIVVIPNYINENIFKIQNSEKYFDIAIVGRLSRIKQNELILKVISRLIRNDCQYKNLKLVFVGEGECEAFLRNKVEEYGIKNNVLFLGNKNPNGVSKIYNQSKLYVSVSQVETFGVPVIEAWFSGVPVIVFDNHPLSKYINKENGYIVKKNDLEELENTISTALNREWESFEIRKIAIRSFSKNLMIEQLINVYESEGNNEKEKNSFKRNI